MEPFHDIPVLALEDFLLRLSRRRLVQHPGAFPF